MSNQFGGNQNPPWVRQDFAPQNNTAAPMLQPNVSYPFTQQAQQQQNQFAPQPQIGGPGPTLQPTAPQSGGLLPQPGIALPTSLSASTVAQVNPVSYPVKTQAGHAGSVPKQRMFTGSVTKMHDTFGFVDEEVFFQMSVVKGMIPKVGDRVLVEASYNANMPFKWNATRVVSLHDNVASNQVISMQQQQQQQQQQHQHQQQQQQQQLKAIQQQAMGLMGAGPMMGSSNAQMLGGPPSGISGGQGLLSNPPGPPPLMTGLNKFQSAGIQQGAFNPPNNRSGVNTGPGLLGDPRPRSLLTQMKDQRNPGGMAGSSSGGSSGGGGGGRGGDAQKERDRRDRERRERRAEERRKRSRSPVASNKRSRSPVSSVRSRSPVVKRRPTRPTPRYVVQIPKILLDVTEASVMLLKAKYSNMYIPSDFFHTSFPWVDNFPLTRPFSLGQHCTFHIMHKEIPPIKDSDIALEPNDADYLFSAKVMLMASPALEDLYKKSCCLAEDLPDAYDNAQHPARLLNFLVGTRGKNEPMAIGGPWSPSLDGANPQANPQVLIKTAIRTTRALTGIDLSSCTQWYRFTEIRYFRPESKHKDRLQPARVETVVIFLPDVWNCNPTHLEWNSLQAAYQKQLQMKLNPELAIQQEEEEEMEAEAPQEDKTEPSHFSTLDPKTMKVGDLRMELELRNMPSKGLKSQLVARLAKAIKAEEEAEKASKEEEAEKKKEEEAARVIEEQKVKEKAKEEDDEKDEAKKKEEEEKQRKEKREKAILERRYKVPDNPAILVHPSPTAKSGKFDCSVMSLSVLLDYRPEDNKEHSFEVSLFAELFNEMLMRDFGFQIYSSVALAPPKKEEDKKKDDNKKDEKKEDKEKKDDDKKEKDQDKKDKKDDKKEKKDLDKKEDKEGSSPKRRKVENKEVGEGDAKETSPDKEKDKDDKSDKSDKVDKDKDKEEKKKKKEEEKKKTKNPSLLLAFSYFDQNHCGYLADKDVEDIIHTLGLKLSRAQVKKMVQKVLHHDSFKYRKLTDGVLNDKGDFVDEKVEHEDVPKIEPEQLARGNRESLRKLLELSGTKSEKTDHPSTPVKNKNNDGNFVDYKGSLLDVESLMQKLDRSEKSRAALEKTLLVTNEELKTAKSNLSESEKDNGKLTQELRKVKSDLEGEKSTRTSSEATNHEWQQLAMSSRTHIVNALKSLNSIVRSDESKEGSATGSSDKKSKTEEGKKNGVKEELIDVKIENEQSDK